MQGSTRDRASCHHQLHQSLSSSQVIATAINHKGTQDLTFARASQNVATAAALLDTLPTPSINGVSKVYRQLKDILDVATKQHAESSLQRRGEVSILSPGCSKASRQRTVMENLATGTTCSPMWAT
jgi:hypothetical protein